MSQAKNGDTVKVHYTGKLNDGSVFDSSQEREPIEFEIGEGKLIPDFEESIVGMTPADSKTISIPAKKAYGEYNEELIMEVKREELPADMNPEVGQQLQASQEDGKMILLIVKEVAEATVKLDANHPLAGQDLTFEIKLVEIITSRR